jgi:protein JSN1
LEFARVPTKTSASNEEGNVDGSAKLEEGLGSIKGATGVSPQKQLSSEGGGVENYRSQLVQDLVKAGVHEQILEKGLASEGTVSEQQMIMQVLSAGRTEEDPDVRAAAGE